MSKPSNIADLDAQRPHVIVVTSENRAHVIPRLFFENVVLGKISITELDDWQNITRRIVEEWLGGLND